MPPSALNEREIFIAARQKEDAAEREAFVAEACGDDAALRQRIHTLLAEQDKLGSFLESSPVETTATVDLSELTERPGTVIGPYRLLEQIGEGGFGVVFMAEQMQPVRRRVAVKILKPGMDTRHVIARFEAERQALAIMDHANIARVFDGGSTPTGRPFFVMELVKGIPITEYCDQDHLTPRQRLELFISVCHAVQHAHQKGIIHRDLKPSNILISRHDATPVVKVIDFGVAKALGQELTDRTLFTGFAQMIGTPLYMSPEQAGMSDLDIDTRSDTYSLGVLLYELLTGTTPFTKERFQRATYDEIRRIIREEDPPRPSTRLSDTWRVERGAQRTERETAKLKGAPRSTLRAQRFYELDWIVMKAMEKDRNLRYETASGLARDVQRYLADEPVQACPPSSWYRFRKFVRRNKRALATAALLSVMLLVAMGAVAGSIGWTMRDREARRARVAGQLELMLDEVHRLESEQKWPEALVAARRAEALLAVGDGDEQLNHQLQDVLADLKLVQRLEEIRMEQSAHESNQFEWAGQSYAAAFRAFGVDLERMSPDEAAQRLCLRKDIAPVLSVILDEWGVWRGLSGDTPGAQSLWTVAGRLDPDPWRQQMRAVLAQIDTKHMAGSNFVIGQLDPRTVEDLTALATSPDLARQPPATLYHLGMALSQGGGKHELGTEVLRKAYQQYPGDFWINVGLNWSVGRLGPAYQDEAVSFARAAFALRPNDAWCWMKAGEVYQYHYKRLDDANNCYQKAIELDPNNAWVHIKVGRGLLAQTKPTEAVARFRKAIELDPTVAIPHINLGNILRGQKKLDDAIDSYRQAIELNPKISNAHYLLGLALLDQHLAMRDDKLLEEAVTAFAKAADLAPKNGTFLWGLGRALHRQKKLEDAVVCFHKGIDLDPKHANCHWGLAFVLLDQDKASEAVASFQNAIALGENSSHVYHGLGLGLQRVKRYDEAAAALGKSVELDPNRVEAHYQLGAVLIEQRKWSEASTPLMKVIELDANHPDGHYLLGQAMVQQGKLAEGIAHFLKAIELNHNGDPLHYFFLAMAYWQIGEEEKARQAYDKGVHWMDKNHSNSEELGRFQAETAEMLGVMSKD